MSCKKTPPSWLNNEAKKFWRKLYQRTDNDELLGILCTALATYRQATEAINSEGIVLQTQTGALKQNPATYVQRDAFAQIIRLRDILALVESDEPDELDAIFSDE